MGAKAWWAMLNLQAGIYACVDPQGLHMLAMFLPQQRAPQQKTGLHC
jgi:hypothetical protein